MTVDDGGGARLAPVIPLFGGKVAPASELPTHSETAPRRTEAAPATLPSIEPLESESAEEAPGYENAPSLLRAIPSGAEQPGEQEAERDAEQIREVGEESLVRKLRARSLSISEARQVLRGHDLERSQIDDVIDDFCRRGYLDDAILAEQLVISGIERKGQGRVALSRALSQRGIPRDVIDAALGDLPDDDAERALEFARTKARSMTRLDFDTALRRLMGQLARRGYGGSVAMSAARTALTEASLGKPTSGVRFVDSE
ncbi:regulatory protein RecX [Microbacterium murale]|uniref:Regulatory protein RecX n=1 Tax=Microbacterium murale TaxID=1081040 RepID=A0ABU0PD51_9MICO|nr:regulatory protein RecX [Microbacterium murale]MDQ0645261.1 regulatory protein [Microbacterium murale]